MVERAVEAAQEHSPQLILIIADLILHDDIGSARAGSISHRNVGHGVDSCVGECLQGYHHIT